ncbi:DUF2339 domain-containing protein [Paenibacillus daejeonensis]|uniref:DUF2339 domain-containing protein n=1 Tax=Paenibacillus daejeonensis TaxID=135193 RepID=UPI00036473BC|nr:DUF2339 domain-containing protein [Paenibacillus daejeonensis]
MSTEERLRALEAKVERLEHELDVLRQARGRGERMQWSMHEVEQPDSSHAGQAQPDFAPSAFRPPGNPRQEPPTADSEASSAQPGRRQVPPLPPYGADPAPYTPRPATDWEHVARVWLPRVFVVVLLLGVLWGFTAAVSAGFINEPVRCLIGIVAAAIMYILGERQLKGGRDALGQVLIGGAVAILILAGVAAYTLYDLIDIGVAGVFFVGTVGLGVLASLRHRSQSLMLVAMVAGYLIPLLLTRDTPNPWLYIGYETLFSIAMLIIAARLNFRVAYGAAFGLLHLPLILYAVYDFDEYRTIFLLAVILQHLTLYGLAAFYKPTHSATYRQSVLFAGFMAMAGWFYVMYGIRSAGMYGVLLGAATILHGATAYLFYRQRKLYVVFGILASVGLTLWLLHTVDIDFVASTLVLQGTAAIILGLYLRNNLQFLVGLAIYALGAVGTINMPIETLASGETVNWLMLLVTLPILYKYRNLGLEEGKQPPSIVQSVMWAEGLLLLYFITQVTQLLSSSLADETQRLLISGVWIVYAIAVIVVGIVLQRARVRLAGVGFLFLTLIKIIFVDLPGVSPAVRAILFIGLGVAGIAASRLLYRKKE